MRVHCFIHFFKGFVNELEKYFDYDRKILVYITEKLIRNRIEHMKNLMRLKEEEERETKARKKGGNSENFNSLRFRDKVKTIHFASN